MTIVSLVGWMIDTVFLHVQLMSYASPTLGLSWVAPLWLLLLYAQFATAIEQSMVWMRNYAILAALATFRRHHQLFSRSGNWRRYLSSRPPDRPHRHRLRLVRLPPRVLLAKQTDQ